MANGHIVDIAWACMLKNSRTLLTEIIMSALLAWMPLTCLEAVDPDAHNAYTDIQKSLKMFLDRSNMMMSL